MIELDFGPCRGMVDEGSKKVPCGVTSRNRHYTPSGAVYFLCDDCEVWMNECMDDDDLDSVRAYTVGGKRTTG